MTGKDFEPCPFCGSHNLRVDSLGVDPWGVSMWYWVTCMDCLTRGPPSSTCSGEAIVLWNDRGPERWGTTSRTTSR